MCMTKAAKNLRIAGVLQIILGILTIALTYFLLSAGDVSVAGLNPERALGVLALNYCGAAFQIFSGFVALARAGKRSFLAVICGIALFIPQLIHFIHLQNQIGLIIANAALLVIPYYYLHNAYKNFRAH